MMLSSQRVCSRAVIIAIGDELILGQTVDTNSAWLSSTLADHGIRVLRQVTVDDDLERLASTTEQAVEEADLVILTGGLGPTADDLTREALCKSTGDTLVEDAAALEALSAWYGQRAMPETNRVQAMRPSRGRCLPNDCGTAPGIVLDRSEALIVALPGPPAEMKPMFERFVLPAIVSERVVRTRVLHTVGIGESNVAEKLGSLMKRDRMPVVGTTASGGIVSVRIRSEATDAAEAESALEADVSRVGEILGSIIIRPQREPGDTHERGIHALVREVMGILHQRGEMLSVCESCTAGLLAGTFADVPGSSAVLAGGFITYSNVLKQRLVGVDPEVLDRQGAVSPEVAIAMAQGALERTGADHALSVTGVAGPGGGSEAKPVGTVWIGCSTRGQAPDVRRFNFKHERQTIRQRSVVAALAMLRQHLLRLNAPLLGEVERIGDER